jgi:hypothetical protein
VGSAVGGGVSSRVGSSAALLAPAVAVALGVGVPAHSRARLSSSSPVSTSGGGDDPSGTQGSKNHVTPSMSRLQLCDALAGVIAGAGLATACSRPAMSTAAVAAAEAVSLLSITIVPPCRTPTLGSTKRSPWMCPEGDS